MLTAWASQLNPVLANPLVQGVMITGIVLPANTDVTIPTTLGRMQQGWFVTDNIDNCNIWRTQPFNSQNMTLQSSGTTTISLWVF